MATSVQLTSAEAALRRIDLVGLATQTEPIAGVDARGLARELYGVEGEPEPLHGERNDNYRIVDRDGRALILKISGELEDLQAIDLQIALLDHIAAQDPGFPAPSVIRTRDGRKTVDLDGALAGHRLFAISVVPGQPLETVDYGLPLLSRIGELLARLDVILRGFHHPWTPRALAWDIRNAPALAPVAALIEDKERRKLVEALFTPFIEQTLPRFGRLRSQFVHADGNGPNILVRADGNDVEGIVDFGDASFSPLIVELAIAGADIVREGTDPLDSIAALVEGYTAVVPLEAEEIGPLHDSILARIATGLAADAWRRRFDNAGVDLLARFDGPRVDAGERMLSHGRERAIAAISRTARRALVVPAVRPPPGARSAKDLIARRHKVLGRGLALTYREPVHIVRGEGVWLFDADGRRYLDAYNNVAQVGHCHPHVVEALARQAATLNTNTRYLHDTIVTYAERLIATMPDVLDCAIFVNSGSEANDVAWRIARVVTGNAGGIVMEHAYHGITDAIAALSPYNPESDGLRPHVRTLMAPETYRGPWGRDVADAGSRYSEDADRAISSLAEAGLRPALFMVDTGLTSNGIPDTPRGYLAAVVAKVRAAGGLYVADEVQFGVGRPGTTMWGFAFHGTVPDIVTMGKPIADGQPLGVVVTRIDILERFLEATGFFSTFGGNPVSAAAGLATLEVLERERLQDNALATGGYFKKGLAGLMARHEQVGDVRGAGLLIGIDIVANRATKKADMDETDRIKNRLRERGILVGTEGAAGNIIKVRPPLPFRPEHADMVIAALDEVLAER